MIEGEPVKRTGEAALAVVLVASICGCGGGGVSDGPPGAPGAEWEVRRGAFESRVMLTGELKAIHADRIVVPRTPTWQMQIRWIEEDGAEVQVGQQVLELDNTQFAGNLLESRLAESNSLNALMRKEAEIEIDLAEKRFQLERTRILLEKAAIQASIPPEVIARRTYQEHQLAEAKAEVEQRKALEALESSSRAAEAELEELSLALEKARDEVRTAEEAIEALNLTAPRDGIIVVGENRREGRKFQVGDNVWIGLPVMEIPELSAMKVEAWLSDVDDGKIAVGMPATCTVDTYPDRLFSGQVVEITPVATEQGRQSLRRAFRVAVHLDESDPELMRPGMSVRVEVRPPSRDDVLLAPREAIDFREDPPLLRLASGTTEVRLGPCNARECVIEEGADEYAESRSDR